MLKTGLQKCRSKDKKDMRVILMYAIRHKFTESSGDIKKYHVILKMHVKCKCVDHFIIP